MASPARSLSVVVVAYDMARELPRTIRSLGRPYQRDADDLDYEVIVVDNGSPTAVDGAALEAAFGAPVRVERLDPAPPSPARAANLGLELAGGDVVGLWIDGARLASPGLLAGAVRGTRLHERPVVATLGWHLGPVPHMRAAREGYDQSVEDGLLTEAGWEADGYRLFEISTLAGSSRFGWFGPLSESNALFLRRETWRELGGLDERFELPGGGLVNLDLYRRACALPGVEVIVLLGEGTFHQIHGGAATTRWVDLDAMRDEYHRVTGEVWAPPQNPGDRLYVGRMPEAALAHLERSARLASKAKERGGFRARASDNPAG